MTIANNPKKIKINDFINFSLSTLFRLKKEEDYVICADSLYLNHIGIKSKIEPLLKEVYPEYHYYWKSPRILTWFKQESYGKIFKN